MRHETREILIEAIENRITACRDESAQASVERRVELAADKRALCAMWLKVVQTSCNWQDDESPEQRRLGIKDSFELARQAPGHLHPPAVGFDAGVKWLRFRLA